ncbi:MAG: TetR/AcrR family transcriptional regulator [Deltaproteobacteria bacterium]|nr:TetR/AcrR family transcriptional regulator [Deltaproteobacteria bacterium]
MAVAERRERERAARREAILDAAQELTAEVGYQALRMDAVAEAAELSKGTLYLYFANKEALCAGVATRLIDLLLPLLEKNLAKASSGLDAVRQVLQTYCEFTRDHPHHFRFALTWLSAGERLDDSSEAFQLYRDRVGSVLQHAVAAIERGQADGSVRSDIDPLPQALQLWSSMLGVILIDLNKESISQRIPVPVDLDQIVNLHIDTMARALAGKELS